MKKKLVNKDPFSNGREEVAWEMRNCELCIKGSVRVVTAVIKKTKR